MTQRVRLVGAERIETNLLAIGRTAENVATLRPGAQILKTEMQLRVPKDTLQLHDSIDIRQKGNRLEIGAGGDGFYGYFLERGTSKMAAQPWVAPSVDAARARAVAAIGRKVGVKVDQVWGR